MLMWPTAAWVVALVLAFSLSVFATWFGIAYATRRRLFDLPGRRRSHAIPTPRGGGIGIALSVLFSLVGFAGWTQSLSGKTVAGLVSAIMLVALVGWIDDHRGLKATTRFAAHCVAALFALGIPAAAGFTYLAGHAVVMYGAVCAMILIATVWSINLHNFMDGIDGLLALQALFVLTAVAVLFAHAGSRIEAECIALLVAAVAGFVPFNFPRARIFMGDVGSGLIGLLIALAVLWQMTTPRIALASGVVLCSAFVIDATCTLLLRVLLGRRWYSAHREHLYQWLVRCGFSHVHVVTLYMGWNLFVVLPVVCWMNWMPEVASANALTAAVPPAGIGAAAAVYALAVALWWYGKRWCLGTAVARRLHAAA